MRPSAFSTTTVASTPLLTARQREALLLLREAAEAARKEGLEIWQFAVEIDQLRALGLSHTDLRCLLCWDYLEHARERTTTSTSERFFQPLHALVLPKQTCFVLTLKGREVVAKPEDEKKVDVARAAKEPTLRMGSVPEVPRWDGEAGQLWWEEHLIKAFHRPAVNQELVLAALQEEGWPPRIDDPLPPTGDIDPKVRLRDTIKALNRHHLHRILHFGGDGKGQGVRWVMGSHG